MTLDYEHALPLMYIKVGNGDSATLAGDEPTESGGRMRRHCIISLARSGEAKKWMWHTELEPGSPLMQSPEEFLSFEECVNDARRHGHYHVEVPVLKDDSGASRVAGAPQTGLSAAGGDETES